MKKRVRTTFGRITDVRKDKARKVRESNQGVGEVKKKGEICYKKWVKHEHQRGNRAVVAC